MTSGILREPTGGFPKERRIRSRRDYQRIQEQGLRLQTRYFVFVLANRPPGAEVSSRVRLGIVASRRVGNAVVRNRVKRLVREAFRVAGVLFGEELDVVVIARCAREGWKLADVIAEWASAEARIKRLSTRLALARGA